MKKQTNLPAAGRKLSLNKKTISNLNSSEMSRQMGGSYFDGHRCGGETKLYTCNGKTCNGHNTCQYTCV